MPRACVTSFRFIYSPGGDLEPKVLFRFVDGASVVCRLITRRINVTFLRLRIMTVNYVRVGALPACIHSKAAGVVQVRSDN